VFKFLCHRVGGREEQGIKTLQEIGPAGTPLNAVIEQLDVPLVHLASPITSIRGNRYVTSIVGRAYVPADGTRLAIDGSGDFGTSPFLGQLSA
jgi:hypothetical protein